MKVKDILVVVCCMLTATAYGQKYSSWGDQENGTYINPVLNADFSDPDVIRVGTKYYMVCSEFHYMGMTIQESDDMVNWKIAGRIFGRINIPSYDKMERYGSGSWAPAIRYHNDKFYVYFCTPDDGLFMTTAEKPEGPWEPLCQVVDTAGWEDPCPFWDEGGQAYLCRSNVGAGPIIIHRMSEDGKSLLDGGVTVYTGPVAEGTKIYKLNGYYYFSIPEGGVVQGWQTVLRSKNIFGPFEKKVVLEKGATKINGPHQGALVDTPNGEWWFFHFQMVKGSGRVMHLQPVSWQNDWPVVGVDIDRNGIGEPVYVWKKPDVGRTFPVCVPQSSDEFSSTQLGLQWQWNHNPVDEAWSLSQRPGWLSLTALKAPVLQEARNTLTQRIIGDYGEVIAQVDGAIMMNGQKAGLALMSRLTAVGIKKVDGKFYLFFDNRRKESAEIAIKKPIVYLKVKLNIPDEKAWFYYSLDGKAYQPIGSKIKLVWRNWKGDRVGLFSYNGLNNGGTAAFNYFHYEFDGPDQKLNQ
ncbi:beta-xylosidase [Labilibaculum manganireducens]|uniref:Beta-xylosidase n=1 Tax=Labilibaculum manganireducens TaxID=1940525 RepID=A0A2N3I6T8_9BACT|nr:glycoside hydrolase 43 family protein [Labilibaculum manganireducens]PKQ66011.1 beta-xylosidase [Labilibaculum manganireducens]